jgi:CubicO group peptidase (beta-lactamase class C family)
MDRRSAVAAIAAGLAAPGIAWGKTAGGFAIDKARIDAALRQMVIAGRAAGASALVWQGGAERYFGAFGDADREAKRPMARDTLVQIFSMTKPVTGIALMQLWEQGKFGLDDPLARYLPAFGAMKVLGDSGADGKPALRTPARPIAIRDIMRHTAGFSYGMRDTAADKIFHDINPLALTNSLDEFGDKLAKVPLLFDPGAEWSYSTGVDVQALLVEHLTGEAFEPHVRRAILDPLGMKDTGWTQPSDRLPRFAASYAKQPDGTLARIPDDGRRGPRLDARRLYAVRADAARARHARRHSHRQAVDRPADVDRSARRAHHPTLLPPRKGRGRVRPRFRGAHRATSQRGRKPRHRR